MVVFLASLLTNRIAVGAVLALFIIGGLAGLYAKGRMDGRAAAISQSDSATIRDAKNAQKARDGVRRDNLDGGLLNNDGWQRP